MPEKNEEHKVDGGEEKISAELRMRLKEVEAQMAQEFTGSIPTKKIVMWLLVCFVLFLLMVGLWAITRVKL